MQIYHFSLKIYENYVKKLKTIQTNNPDLLLKDIINKIITNKINHECIASKKVINRFICF